jgi:hypothetical protein
MYVFKNALAYCIVVVKSEAEGLATGSNLMTVNFNASAVKIYNSTGSLVRFEN